ncbi:hypothetical protein FACS189449_07480 [Alphaproteobacteria bacterium]|nr:hypothetical protein FACS189449_07480 [Alphaproteobacteria bacterium]
MANILSSEDKATTVSANSLKNNGSIHSPRLSEGRGGVMRTRLRPIFAAFCLVIGFSPQVFAAEIPDEKLYEAVQDKDDIPEDQKPYGGLNAHEQFVLYTKVFSDSVGSGTTTNVDVDATTISPFRYYPDDGHNYLFPLKAREGKITRYGADYKWSGNPSIAPIPNPGKVMVDIGRNNTFPIMYAVTNRYYGWDYHTVDNVMGIASTGSFNNTTDQTPTTGATTIGPGSLSGTGQTATLTSLDTGKVRLSFNTTRHVQSFVANQGNISNYDELKNNVARTHTVDLPSGDTLYVINGEIIATPPRSSIFFGKDVHIYAMRSNDNAEGQWGNYGAGSGTHQINLGISPSVYPYATPGNAGVVAWKNAGTLVFNGGYAGARSTGGRAHWANTGTIISASSKNVYLTNGPNCLNAWAEGPGAAWSNTGKIESTHYANIYAQSSSGVVFYNPIFYPFGGDMIWNNYDSGEIMLHHGGNLSARNSFSQTTSPGSSIIGFTGNAIWKNRGTITSEFDHLDAFAKSAGGHAIWTNHGPITAKFTLNASAEGPLSATWGNSGAIEIWDDRYTEIPAAISDSHIHAYSSGGAATWTNKAGGNITYHGSYDYVDGVTGDAPGSSNRAPAQPIPLAAYAEGDLYTTWTNNGRITIEKDGADMHAYSAYSFAQWLNDGGTITVTTGDVDAHAEGNDSGNTSWTNRGTMNTGSGNVDLHARSTNGFAFWNNHYGIISSTSGSFDAFAEGPSGAGWHNYGTMNTGDGEVDLRVYSENGSANWWNETDAIISSISGSVVAFAEGNDSGIPTSWQNSGEVTINNGNADLHAYSAYSSAQWLNDGGTITVLAGTSNSANMNSIGAINSTWSNAGDIYAYGSYSNTMNSSGEGGYSSWSNTGSIYTENAKAEMYSSCKGEYDQATWTNNGFMFIGDGADMHAYSAYCHAQWWNDGGTITVLAGDVDAHAEGKTGNTYWYNFGTMNTGEGNVDLHAYSTDGSADWKNQSGATISSTSGSFDAYAEGKIGIMYWYNYGTMNTGEGNVDLHVYLTEGNASWENSTGAIISSTSGSFDAYAYAEGKNSTAYWTNRGTMNTGDGYVNLYAHSTGGGAEWQNYYGIEIKAGEANSANMNSSGATYSNWTNSGSIGGDASYSNTMDSSSEGGYSIWSNSGSIRAYGSYSNTMNSSGEGGYSSWTNSGSIYTKYARASMISSGEGENDGHADWYNNGTINVENNGADMYAYSAYSSAQWKNESSKRITVLAGDVNAFAEGGGNTSWTSSGEIIGYGNVDLHARSTEGEAEWRNDADAKINVAGGVTAYAEGSDNVTWQNNSGATISSINGSVVAFAEGGGNTSWRNSGEISGDDDVDLHAHSAGGTASWKNYAIGTISSTNGRVTAYAKGLGDATWTNAGEIGTIKDGADMYVHSTDGNAEWNLIGKTITVQAGDVDLHAHSTDGNAEWKNEGGTITIEHGNADMDVYANGTSGTARWTNNADGIIEIQPGATASMITMGYNAYCTNNGIITIDGNDVQLAASGNGIGEWTNNGTITIDGNDAEIYVDGTGVGTWTNSGEIISSGNVDTHLGSPSIFSQWINSTTGKITIKGGVFTIGADVAAWTPYLVKNYGEIKCVLDKNALGRAAPELYISNANLYGFGNDLYNYGVIDLREAGKLNFNGLKVYNAAQHDTPDFTRDVAAEAGTHGQETRDTEAFPLVKEWKADETYYAEAAYHDFIDDDDVRQFFFIGAPRLGVIFPPTFDNLEDVVQFDNAEDGVDNGKHLTDLPISRGSDGKYHDADLIYALEKNEWINNLPEIGGSPLDPVDPEQSYTYPLDVNGGLMRWSRNAIYMGDADDKQPGATKKPVTVNLVYSTDDINLIRNAVTRIEAITDTADNAFANLGSLFADHGIPTTPAANPQTPEDSLRNAYHSVKTAINSLDDARQYADTKGGVIQRAIIAKSSLREAKKILDGLPDASVDGVDLATFKTYVDSYITKVRDLEASLAFNGSVYSIVGYTNVYESLQEKVNKSLSNISGVSIDGLQEGVASALDSANTAIANVFAGDTNVAGNLDAARAAIADAASMLPTLPYEDANKDAVAALKTNLGKYLSEVTALKTEFEKDPAMPNAAFRNILGYIHGSDSTDAFINYDANDRVDESKKGDYIGNVEPVNPKIVFNQSRAGYVDDYTNDKYDNVFKQGTDYVYYAGDNSWYNGVLNLDGGGDILQGGKPKYVDRDTNGKITRYGTVAEFSSDGAIFGGDINIKNGAQLIWHGGAKDPSNKPNIVLSDGSNLTFDLPANGDRFSVYGNISCTDDIDDHEDLTHMCCNTINLNKGTVYLKGDCSGFMGEINVADGAQFIVRSRKNGVKLVQAEDGSESGVDGEGIYVPWLGEYLYEGKMFGGVLKMEENHVATIETSEEMKSRLDLPQGTLNIEDSTSDSGEAGKKRVRRLRIGEKEGGKYAKGLVNFAGAELGEAGGDPIEVKGENSVLKVRQRTKIHHLKVEKGTLRLRPTDEYGSEAGDDGYTLHIGRLDIGSTLETRNHSVDFYDEDSGDSLGAEREDSSILVDTMNITDAMKWNLDVNPDMYYDRDGSHDGTDISSSDRLYIGTIAPESRGDIVINDLKFLSSPFEPAGENLLRDKYVFEILNYPNTAPLPNVYAAHLGQYITAIDSNNEPVYAEIEQANSYLLGMEQDASIGTVREFLVLTLNKAADGSQTPLPPQHPSQLPDMELMHVSNISQIYDAICGTSDYAAHHEVSVGRYTFWNKSYYISSDIKTDTPHKLSSKGFATIFGYDGELQNLEEGYAYIPTVFAGYTTADLEYSDQNGRYKGALVGAKVSFFDHGGNSKDGHFKLDLLGSYELLNTKNHIKDLDVDLKSHLFSFGAKVLRSFALNDDLALIPSLSSDYSFVSTCDEKLKDGRTLKNNGFHSLNPSAGLHLQLGDEELGGVMGVKFNKRLGGRLHGQIQEENRKASYLGKTSSTVEYNAAIHTRSKDGEVTLGVTRTTGNEKGYSVKLNAAIKI